MEITIERDGDVTTMTMVHSGFSEDAKFDDEYEGMKSGWDVSLAILEHYLEHHNVRTDRRPAGGAVSCVKRQV